MGVWIFVMVVFVANGLAMWSAGLWNTSQSGCHWANSFIHIFVL